MRSELGDRLLDCYSLLEGILGSLDCISCYCADPFLTAFMSGLVNEGAVFLTITFGIFFIGPLGPFYSSLVRSRDFEGVVQFKFALIVLFAFKTDLLCLLPDGASVLALGASKSTTLGQ